MRNRIYCHPRQARGPLGTAIIELIPASDPDTPLTIPIARSNNDGSIITAGPAHSDMTSIIEVVEIDPAASIREDVRPMNRARPAATHQTTRRFHPIRR